MNKTLNLLVCLAFVPVASASAGLDATIVDLQGKVVILTPEGVAKAQGIHGAHSRFEGKDYIASEASAGAKVGEGTVIRAMPGGRGRMIYENGDTVLIHSGSAFRVSNSQANQTTYEMMAGKIQSTIQKGGPRHGLRIRARSATMGVRGTDFVVNDRVEGGADVSVFSGKVTVTPNTGTGAKPFEVSSQQTLELKPESGTWKAKKHNTTQAEIKELIDGAPPEAAEGNFAPLRQAADRLLRQEHQLDKVGSTDGSGATRAAVLQKLTEKAPTRAEYFDAELGASDKAYDKFFKNK